jgi:hypothetical protein
VPVVLRTVYGVAVVGLILDTSSPLRVLLVPWCHGILIATELIQYVQASDQYLLDGLKTLCEEALAKVRGACVRADPKHPIALHV